jgi:FkbM family methyltransferase
MAISDHEKLAVKQLTKYFSDHWIIVDVGSNKGQWSDLLINERDSSDKAGRYTVHMFEPNDMLLNFTRIKYDYNPNIYFNELAAYCVDNIDLQFNYFTNFNSGLSSIYFNEKWENLPMRHKLVKSVTLNTAIQGDIDIIKIDVEGAEFDVIVGCTKLLEGRKVKFIQVEYSEHYPVAGYNFRDIIDLVNMNGYHVYSFDGEYFHEIKASEFVEDYRYENFYISYIHIERYHYTQLWNGEFIKNTQGLPKVHMALEIGCFEGLTTNYICDNLLLPEGRVICVDPLTDEYLPNHDDNQMFVGQFERFRQNTKDSPVELFRLKSCNVYEDIKHYRFGLIYIDGDHTFDGVYNDGVMALRVSLRNTFILFDDYEWRNETAAGIDRFINEHQQNVHVIKKNYQVLVKVIKPLPVL